MVWSRALTSWKVSCDSHLLPTTNWYDRVVRGQGGGERTIKQGCESACGMVRQALRGMAMAQLCLLGLSLPSHRRSLAMCRTEGVCSKTAIEAAALGRMLV